MDRNTLLTLLFRLKLTSLSARRAWIEMFLSMGLDGRFKVALRKESVDRNHAPKYHQILLRQSLSARRAWIEILLCRIFFRR